MRRLTILSTVCFLNVLFALNAHGATQYRCNGRVQYRPCNQKIVITRSVKKTTGTKALLNAQQNAAKASFKYQKEMRDGPLYADILKANYQRHPNKKNYGQWRGIVKGNGDIHLSLIISQKGLSDESRYMGHVKLIEDQTSFNFVSSPPKGSSWTWKIMAVPKSS